MNKRIDKKKQKQLAPVVIAVPEKPEEISFHIQYQGQDYLASDIIKKIREKCMADGASETDLKDLSIYLKPEDQKAYYTYGNINGFICL